MFRKVNRLYAASKNLTGLFDYLKGLYHYHASDAKSAKVNLGQMQAELNRNKPVLRLKDAEFQVFSQFGDDGIIQWLTQRIPFPNKTFIEFGVENYREANTRFLLVNNYWSGMVLDGSQENIFSLQQERLYAQFDIEAKASFITAANINSLLQGAGFAPELGILSIDIDGNDYWVWKAIDVVKPVLVICEYNALFGFEHPYTVPYRPDFVRGKEYPLNYYGISLLSACDLAAEKGYRFIGCNQAGNNAYFLQEPYLQYLGWPPPAPAEEYSFACFTEAYDPQLGWKRGADKIRHINGLPVVNTRTGATEAFDADAVIRSLTQHQKLTRL